MFDEVVKFSLNQRSHPKCTYFLISKIKNEIPLYLLVFKKGLKSKKY